VFLVYRRQEKKATSAIWNELEEDAIIQEKVKGKKPEVEEEEEMDLLNT
jgi:hypothetical protein